VLNVRVLISTDAMNDETVLLIQHQTLNIQHSDGRDERRNYETRKNRRLLGPGRDVHR
jgi:hypothetical protein